jgi:hypothetical protein
MANMDRYAYVFECIVPVSGQAGFPTVSRNLTMKKR